MHTQSTNSKTNRRGCLGMGLRIITGLILVVALLSVFGAVYEARAETAVAEQYPAPGELVDMNGRTMHIHCIGTGSPTIILDAGQGGWSSDWANIMPQLSENNRVCAYDRAGYGWSEAAADDRSPQAAADDLAALLTAAQIEPPYVLVGFSHAGLAGRLFAAQHRDELAGLVLIDPATEFDSEIMSDELMRQQQSAVGMINGFNFAAKIGLLRAMGTENMAGSAPFIGTDPAIPEVYYPFIAHPQWWETSAQEFQSHLNEDHLATVREQGQIPNIPLIIIGSDVLDTTGNPAMDSLQAVRHEKLSELAAQSNQGQFIVAEGSTHNILSDRPNVITDSVKSIIMTASQ